MSENFTMAEFTRSDTASACGIDNSPPPAVARELLRLMDVMERVRELLDDCPVIINSGYRCDELNKEVGGATASEHMTGRACDFVAPDFGTPLDICWALEQYLDALGVDQLIHEMDAWVHLDIAEAGAAPRCECLTINASGTYSGIV